jgi:hypothetical protein
MNDVIARSPARGDEAIQVHRDDSLDCFAALAMTNRSERIQPK